MGDNEEKKQRTVFISHRQVDKDLANALGNTLRNWTAGDVTIHQAFRPDSFVRIGDELTAGIKRALAETNVVLLVYTSAAGDWSYCMWECGLATDPEMQDTRVIVLQCGRDVPAPLEALVRIRIDNADDIEKFATDFHTDPNFFPGFAEAYTPRIDAATLGTRKEQLEKALHEARQPADDEEIPRWDRLSLGLPLSYHQKVGDLRTQGKMVEARKVAESAIRSELFVRSYFGDSPRHFGYDRFPENVRFDHVVSKWRDATGYNQRSWLPQLRREMVRVVLNSPAKADWGLMRSALTKNWWVTPIVNHVRVRPSDNCMEFVVYFYHLPVRSGAVKIGVPAKPRRKSSPRRAPKRKAARSKGAAAGT